MSAFAATRQLLEAKKLSDYVDEKRTELSCVTKNATVADALKLLEKLHVLSVPVVDDDGEYAGCVSVGDLLRAFIQELDTNLGEHWSDNVSSLTAAQLSSIGSHFCARPITKMIHAGDLWLRGDEKTTLMNVVREGFDIKQKKVHHRIFICDPSKSANVAVNGQVVVMNIVPGSEKEEASAMRPTNVIAQTDVISVLQKNKAALGDVVSTKIEDLHMFMGSATTVPATGTALEAFHHMAIDYKSCMGVVDAEGKLVANISISDLRALSTGTFDKLLNNVVDFVTAYNNSTNVESLTPASTFGELLDVLVEKKRHRVYILDEVEKAISLITLTDILRAVESPNEPATAAPYPPKTSSSDSDDDEDDE